MSIQNIKNLSCIIIGASHAGVNCAFALRKEGWEGSITLFDSDPILPYHRPPLSKTYLTNTDEIEKNILKSSEAYAKSEITLQLGVKVKAIHPNEKSIVLESGDTQFYDKLVLATGARALIPPILGIDSAINLFPMRTATDSNNIRTTFHKFNNKRVVVIGGGYIGLETAASLRKLGATVTILEREDRILSRVTVPEMSAFFNQLHHNNGVNIFSHKNVVSIHGSDGHNIIQCDDGFSYIADMIIVGVGIRVNQELAQEAGLEIENGIKVNPSSQTSDENIYAIGDCTFHYNPHYDCYVRLENVQNAVDQAKNAAAAICKKDAIYDTIPWFWSDQYDVKLQMVGLSKAHNEILIRKEIAKSNCFSVWYFKDEQLLAVDAINNGKAYVLGTKFIKSGQLINKSKLIDSSSEFNPTNLTSE